MGAERTRHWTVERGTLWALDAGDPLPPLCPARVAAEFREATAADARELAGAMGLAAEQPVRERLESGRRCFVLTVDGQIASYGWVTRGPERVGELEREFQLRPDEAYIWDCATVAAWRGQRCYSALLSHIVHRLRQEGVGRIWIGASRQNQVSIRGLANAGFRPVLDLIYRRVARLTLMWISLDRAVGRALAAAAYRILITARERRVGPLVVGFWRS